MLIEQVCSSVWNVEDIKLKSRELDIIRARACAYKLCKDFKIKKSLSSIGKYYGGKDYSTVIYALKMFDSYSTEKVFVDNYIECKEMFLDLKAEILNGLDTIEFTESIESEKVKQDLMYTIKNYEDHILVLRNKNKLIEKMYLDEKLKMTSERHEIEIKISKLPKELKDKLNNQLKPFFILNKVVY